MKNLIYCCLAVAAFTFLHSCSDDDVSAGDSQTEQIKLRGGDDIPTLGDGDGDGHGGDGDGPLCDVSVCNWNYLPNDYANINFGLNPDECEVCIWIPEPEGLTGDLCVELTNVINHDDDPSVFIDDINVSTAYTSGEQFCFTLDHSASFYLTVYFITEEGCKRVQHPYVYIECTQCCEPDENTAINFTEIDTDNLYKTFCGKIYASLQTDCEGPFTWEYSAEPGTGLKGSGSGEGSYFDIDAQNDCGLLGPGNYTVTFTDGECFEYTDTYYFEPCNTDLYDEANPAAMQMTDLRIRCTSAGVRLTSQTVAKCCSCTSVTIKITNEEGLETLIEGDVTMEAGCQPATSYFKKIFDYNPEEWSECCNTLEVIDCEGNVIYTEEDLDDPCFE